MAGKLIITKITSEIKRHLAGVILTLLFVFVFVSCTTLKELSADDDVFISKNISSYAIKKIALIPVIPDTKESNGLYNATNYFLDMLVSEFPKLEFADVMDLRKFDFGFAKMILEDIHDKKLMNKQEFYETDLGSLLKKWKCDALIIGSVDSTRRENDKYRKTMFGRNIYLIRVTCYFTYYLISLKDGKVIWKASENGSVYYEPFGDSEIIFELPVDTIALFSPIDEAMYKGLDKLYYKLPEEIFDSE